MQHDFDLIVTGGEVFDSQTGTIAVEDVGFREGKVVAIRPDLERHLAGRVYDASGAIVAPGLIDMHAHVFDCVGDSVDPDEACLPRGTTTVVDGGSAGANTFEAFLRLTQHKATRVLAWLNLSTIGQVDTRVGELLAAPHADVERAVATIERNPESIVGLKARLSTYVVGGTARPVLKLLRECADAVHLPVMVHIGDTGEPLATILEYLRPGDVVSHMMTGRKNGILDAQGILRPVVKEARERGVIFEAARGLNHESFIVLESCLEQGFLPDVISTDLTKDTARDPDYGLPLMASHLMSFGASVTDVLMAMTSVPARVINRPELGTLSRGGIGDCTIVRIVNDPARLVDVDGRVRDVQEQLKVDAVIRNGRIESTHAR